MIISGYQFMLNIYASQRPTLQNVWNEVFPTNSPNAKSLIEISGAPGTGKSLLLYELIVRTALSSLYGGKGCEVIFVDLTHKCDCEVFDKMTQKIMGNSGFVYSQLGPEDSLAKCCEPITFLPCYSMDELEFAFEELESLLWNNKRVALLAIDGIDSFYWDECNKQLQRMSTHYKKLVQRLKQLCEQHNICCAYTADGSYLRLKSNAWSHSPHSAIDHKMKLNKRNGRLYLNGSLIKIDYGGIEFLEHKQHIREEQHKFLP